MAMRSGSFFRESSCLHQIISLAFVLFLNLLALICFAFALSSGVLQHLWYQEGRCTIISKQLLAITDTENDNPSINHIYKPYFKFIIRTTDSHYYEASGYSFDTNGVPGLELHDHLTQQAIVDHYKLGAVYSCWYDPVSPSQALLAWNTDIDFFVVTLLAGIALVGLTIYLYIPFQGFRPMRSLTHLDLDTRLCSRE